MQIKKYAIKHKFLSFLDQCINKGCIFVFKTCNLEDNKMKSLKRLFRKIGEADVHVWGYSTINTKPNK